MKCLAIETSSAACSVALMIDDAVYSRHVIAPMQQSQLILPMIEELLSSSNIDLNQLDALAFGCGPGSFTGIRIATSVIQGLGYATNIPVIPISSLAALAQTAYQEKGWKRLLVAVDARIQEVYWAAYEVNDNDLIMLNGDEHVSKPEEIIAPDSSHWYGVGNAWDVYKNEIKFIPKETDSTYLPMATAIAQLAKEKFKQLSWITAAEAHPVYLRDNVAKKSK